MIPPIIIKKPVEVPNGPNVLSNLFFIIKVNAFNSGSYCGEFRDPINDFISSYDSFTFVDKE